jgi:hypothetical protein
VESGHAALHDATATRGVGSICHRDAPRRIFSLTWAGTGHRDLSPEENCRDSCSRRFASSSHCNRFTGGFALVAYLALVRVALYLVAAPHYGYFRDELYYLACGEHPAWGYVDQPPMIAWMAWLLQHTIGTSLYAIRLLPMLADVATIAVTARLTHKLGGRRWAIFLAALAVLVTPIFLGFSHLFTMNAFDPLLWTLLAWLVVDLIQTGNQRLWLWIGALVGITLLNKYGVLFLVGGLLAGVAASPLRRSFARPWFWAGLVLATMIALPNFLWQLHWNFPFIQLVGAVRRNGRDVMLPPLAYLAQQAQMLSFIPALLVVLGVWFLFSPRGRRYSVLGWGFLSVLGLMLLLKGKFYYVSRRPIRPSLLQARCFLNNGPKDPGSGGSARSMRWPC